MGKNENPLLNSNEHLNPYGFAYRIILDRLKWDLSGLAGDSRRKLKNLRNQYSGQKAVIMCNGPSLNKVDFDSLKNVFTFGLNKVNLLFDRSDFRPSAIVAVNSHVIDQNRDFYNSTDLPLFLDSKAHKIIKGRKNVTFLHSAPIKSFVRDCTISINQGGTVTFVAMELAFHMGFSEVALVGCDHYFSSKGAENSLVSSGNVDENHFDSRYFSGGQLWQLPDLPQSEYSYALARNAFTSHGRKIYNATDGGYLETYDRINLEEFLNNV
ncbi:6-hydroxymethylpterin diphosphokinase MptE-like protein [Pedobacter sp. JY14-1]|uniref:6-hydroxymethylpterin diphosphokinase MptE-like protein n=1 Tax=Pedobacter sp. JY14-1 TaxID=3034151 RepID=UPI0023E16E58|nr:6-hydroxymethylpterin diphosphokinase MptE-like protein [Pedobacter sp. JY14-1]